MRISTLVGLLLPALAICEPYDSWIDLGVSHMNAGRLEAAEPILRKALVAAEGTLGQSHWKVNQVRLLIGKVEYAKGRYTAADSAWRRALSSIEISSPEAAETAGALQLNLGELRRFERRFSEAESLLSQAVAALETLGTGHVLLPAALNHLALTCFEQGKWADAERLYLRALALVEKSSDAAGLQHAVILHNLGRLRVQQSAVADAEALFRGALEIKEKVLGAGHSSLKPLLYDYAQLLRTVRRGKEAAILRARMKKITEPDRETFLDLRDVRRVETRSKQ